MMSPTRGGMMMSHTRGGMMMSPTRGRVKSSATNFEGQGVPPHGTASREEQKQEQVLDQRPAMAQDDPNNLMDMGSE